MATFINKLKIASEQVNLSIAKQQDIRNNLLKFMKAKPFKQAEMVAAVQKSGAKPKRIKITETKKKTLTKIAVTIKG